MSFAAGRGLFSSQRIVYIQLCDITVPPSRIRKKRTKDDDDLTRSILRYGVLQPVSVRRAKTGYELISGTRRFLSARRAGLDEIPCIVLNVDTPVSELISLTENLQRRDLDYIEEAEELYRLIHLHNFSQAEAARCIGKSQSAIANKLRLLKLPKDVLYTARDAGVTERHLRELLRLPEPAQIRAALAKLISEGMTVSDTGKYVDSLINPRKEPKGVIGSEVMFINTVEHAAEIMRKSGFSVTTEKIFFGSCTELKISISRPAACCNTQSGVLVCKKTPEVSQTCASISSGTENPLEIKKGLYSAPPTTPSQKPEGPTPGL